MNNHARLFSRRWTGTQRSTLLSVFLAAALLLGCPGTARAAEQPLSPEAAAWWNGLWYGWRVITAAGGDYSEDMGARCDVVGTIETLDAGGVIVLWDYNSAADGCFLSALGSFHNDESGLGRFYSESGFAFASPLGEKSLSARVAWDFEHLLRIQGTVKDPENAKNWLRFEVYLRPWGMDWEDVRTVESEDVPWPSLLPEHYADWYLDQLARGLDPLAEPEE